MTWKKKTNKEEKCAAYVLATRHSLILSGTYMKNPTRKKKREKRKDGKMHMSIGSVGTAKMEKNKMKNGTENSISNQNEANEVRK